MEDARAWCRAGDFKRARATTAALLQVLCGSTAPGLVYYGQMFQVEKCPRSRLYHGMDPVERTPSTSDKPFHGDCSDSKKQVGGVLSYTSPFVLASGFESSQLCDPCFFPALFFSLCITFKQTRASSVVLMAARAELGLGLTDRALRHTLTVIVLWYTHPPARGITPGTGAG